MSSSAVTATTPLSPYASSVDSAGRTLLAPLQGLSFNEMVANGEGARHANNPNYYRLILLHALFGAFAFLVFTPAAIICARFLIHGPRPRLAMFGHIGFQIASVGCLTITFITGYFAIDKGTWGKNPHHIIGATLYGAMLFQLFFGLFVRWRVNLKIRTAPPLYKMIHQWLGRAVALLGLAQIPIGLYVYGSPKALFVLYATVTFLFLLSWFILEYLRNRGWFDTRFGGVSGQPTPVPEMSEHNGEVHRHPSDVEPGYSRVGMDETPIQTPKKTSRFSSWFARRNSQRGGETIGVPYPYDGTTSMDTSRAPSAQSPAMGGLAPGPGRQGEIPPIPALPVHYENQHSSSSLPSAEFQQRYGNPTGLKDTVLRDSTTLGPRAGHTPLGMPEPQIPQSGQYDQYPAPAFEATPQSSGHSHHTSRSFQQPPTGRFEQMPNSPIGSGGYVEAENGFVPTLAEGSPGRPLPLPPHRRDRSTDSGSRLPIAQSPDQYASEGQTITVGSGAEGSRRQSNVAVQVKLNPDGKSVTVRRLPAEEAERERRERSRARQERALQREMEIERERQARRPQSSRRPRQDTMDSVDRNERGDDRADLRSPTTSYTPSISGQSTTIAGASGGLLGRGGDVQTPTPSNDPTPLNAMSPLIGMQPVRSPIPPGALSSSQRASVTSGTGTAENSEIEQEIIKEQRRRRRREERAGTSQRGGGSAADGGYYGPSGPESQWT
ncbi:hypothetical protein BDD12DRAFT_888827 [Trichophaea hybrida]|nr:hypothetical protein BDD12DRAFT_888827 [Trichophaea hybrida]